MTTVLESDRPATSWRPEDLMDIRQLAVFLHLKPRTLRDTWNGREGVLPPAQTTEDGQPLWTPDQVREMIATVEKGSSKEVPVWEDADLLRTKVVAALHNPPIQLRSFSANLARKRRREEVGLPVDGGPPEPHLFLYGHPLWTPEQIRDFLENRPGPGNHKTKAEGRRGYTGGRPPGTVVKKRKHPAPEAPAE